MLRLKKYLTRGLLEGIMAIIMICDRRQLEAVDRIHRGPAALSVVSFVSVL